jgi:hypothetical protein
MSNECLIHDLLAMTFVPANMDLDRLWITKPEYQEIGVCQTFVAAPLWSRVQGNSEAFLKQCSLRGCPCLPKSLWPPTRRLS